VRPSRSCGLVAYTLGGHPRETSLASDFLAASGTADGEGHREAFYGRGEEVVRAPNPSQLYRGPTFWTTAAASVTAIIMAANIVRMIRSTALTAARRHGPRP
jgi:hypothetical protein